MATGKIGVTTENIFPVIKKFLYSDHEIFLRELVSNAIDATQKLKTLAAFGDFKGEMGELNVNVSVNKEAGTLTISDHGIGMDADDIDKYINQIAFSGAEEFLEKYKDSANSIIGHFGLGFYSAFMVSKKVEIISLSYKENAKPVKWSCDGSPVYTLEETTKNERGTDIVLYIDDDSKQFLEQSKIDELLKKYCRFLPVKVVSGKEQEWKDGKYVDTDRDKVINNVEPLWTKKPSDLRDEDYLNFYHELMPGMEDPMFWIHLNVDYPFTLTGILYFPKIKNNIDIQRNKIQLYCNQVYVTDQVEGVVPEFMMLMQGVIDSPDIPLNVSRSYLQSDAQVKKISSYISKKVAERLDKMFKDDRKAFEQKWDDIKVFIEYGMLTDNKFYDSAMKFSLLKDVDNKYYTFEEYKTLIKVLQTDKDNNLIYLYANNKEDEFSFIQAAKDKGYSVLLMDGQLDNHFIGMIEQKMDKSSFVRVDSDIIDRLIVKEDKHESALNDQQNEILSQLFKSQISKVDNAEFVVKFEKLTGNAAPVTVVQNEFMRRMKDMAAMQPSMSFYGELPDNYSIIVNTEQSTVKKIIAEALAKLEKEISPIKSDIDRLNSEIESIRKNAENQSIDLSEKENEIKSLREKEETLIQEYASNEPLLRQVIDLALLQSNLLKGESLNNFIKRSISLM